MSSVEDLTSIEESERAGAIHIHQGRNNALFKALLIVVGETKRDDRDE